MKIRLVSTTMAVIGLMLMMARCGNASGNAEAANGVVLQKVLDTFSEAIQKKDYIAFSNMLRYPIKKIIIGT